METVQMINKLKQSIQFGSFTYGNIKCNRHDICTQSEAYEKLYDELWQGHTSDESFAARLLELLDEAEPTKVYAGIDLAVLIRQHRKVQLVLNTHFDETTIGVCDNDKILLSLSDVFSGEKVLENQLTPILLESIASGLNMVFDEFNDDICSIKFTNTHILFYNRTGLLETIRYVEDATNDYVDTLDNTFLNKCDLVKTLEQTLFTDGVYFADSARFIEQLSRKTTKGDNISIGDIISFLYAFEFNGITAEVQIYTAVMKMVDKRIKGLYLEVKSLKYIRTHILDMEFITNVLDEYIQTLEPLVVSSKLINDITATMLMKYVKQLGYDIEIEQD